MRMTIAAVLTAMAFDTGTAARHWAERWRCRAGLRHAVGVPLPQRRSVGPCSVVAEKRSFPSRDNYSKSLPKYVERELRNFLDCGVLSRGFTRILCGNCVCFGQYLVLLRKVGCPTWI